MRGRSFFSIVLVLLAATWMTGCGVATPPILSSAETTAAPPQEEAKTDTPALPLQSEKATMTPSPLSRPTETGLPQSGEPAAAREAGQLPPQREELPIFVEVMQTTLLPGPALQRPPTDVGPNRVFAFNPSTRTLYLQSSITIAPSTEVLIGLTTVIQSPNRTYVTGELFQIPSSETAPLTVVAIEAETAALTLTYGEQTFTLAPGQRRSFKQQGEGPAAAIETTVITNHGRLAALGVLPTELDLR